MHAAPIGGPEHCGTVHFVEHCNHIEQAYLDCVHGKMSRDPIVEMTIPSVYDDTLAPQGQHVASLFCQYTPYSFADGSGWTDVRTAS